MIKILIKYSAFLLALIFIAACSELNENIPPVPDIKAHPSGFTDTTSSNFHGKYIMTHNWDMISCQSCHGKNYSGGSAPTCLNCHTYPGGPENCTTCHGSLSSMAPPKDLDGNTSTSEPGVGAHQNHLNVNTMGRSVLCSECHNVPGSLFTPGHIDSDQPAEIIFNGPRSLTVTNEPTTSEYDPSLPLYEPDPTFDYTELTCANTYCHGYFKNGNLENEPVWNDPSTSQCGSCHGNGSNPLPKLQSQGGTHPSNSNCYLCHGGVVDEDLNIIDPFKHIDGLLNLYGNDINY